MKNKMKKAAKKLNLFELKKKRCQLQLADRIKMQVQGHAWKNDAFSIQKSNQANSERRRKKSAKRLERGSWSKESVRDFIYDLFKMKSFERQN